MRNRISLIVLGLAVTVFSASALTLTSVTKEDLPKFKAQPCTLIHLWAAWCAPCVQELPLLLPELAKIAKLNPVVIDVSPPASQERDSKPLLEHIAPPYTVYKKAAGDDDAFLNAMDPKWSGALPYSVLYHKGKKVKLWEGPFKIESLRKAVAALCR